MKWALAAIGVVVVAGIVLAVLFVSRTKGPQVTAKMIYPYVVPESYLAGQQDALRALTKPLGHGIHISLVFDLDGIVESVTPDKLRELNLTPEQAHAQALANLQELARAQKLNAAVFPNGPSGKPFILMGGHWAAATAILLPRLRDFAAGPLGTRDICVSIPHRDAMLVFAQGDRAHRDAVRALVRQKESDGQKPLTFELFTIDDRGIVPFVEGK